MFKHAAKFVVLVLAMLVMLTGATFAQGDRGGGGGGSRPAPSGSGGSVGGPSMSGQAVNAGGQRSAPEVNVQGGGGQSGGFSGGENNIGGVSGGSNFGGNANTGGGGSNFGGGRGQAGGVVVAAGDVDGDGVADAISGRFGGGGFTPPTGEGGSSLSARFAERGSGSFQLGIFQPGEGESWFQLGGFGARGQGGATTGGTNMEGAPWHESGTVPEVPAAFSDLEAVTQAQATAQAAVDSAQGQATEAVNQATAQAQAAYDQFWTDYYAAVDYTAQAYYDTVMASTDYMLQAYYEAVDYATQTVDYYLAYYDQYAAYCAAYPWDCYSYTYDASTNTYYYVGDTSDAPVSTVTIGDVAINVGYPVQPQPAPSAEAYEALVVFANDQLGAVVEPLYAGVATDNVQAVITYLPDEIEAFYLNSTSVSGATYWGLLNGGAAGVSVGDCGAGNCAITQDNLSLQLSSASAGAYGIFASAAAPATAEDALALITRVYPKLEGLAFSQISDVEQGFAFTATAAGLGLDPNSSQPLSVAKVVYAGVVSVNGQSFVYALVAVGEGYIEAVTL
jgi:hypothetical protein